MEIEVGELVTQDSVAGDLHIPSEERKAQIRRHVSRHQFCYCVALGQLGFSSLRLIFLIP